MATVSIKGRIYEDIHLIAFDKDGTLVDFQHLWAGRIGKWLSWLARQHDEGGGDGIDNIYLALCHSLGFDPKTNRIINDSPLAVASMPKIYTIAAAVLYRCGWGWLAAEETIVDSAELINTPLEDIEILPMGDVKGKMRQLAGAGIRIAIVTSDDRPITEATLPILGITKYVDLLVCGDDDLPNKPAPDGLFDIGRQLNIQTSQMLMVGDTASDMKFGRNAGVAGCIGVQGGAGEQKALNQTADVVIDSIEEIAVIE
jgi:phosphoglycolate phosphatase-like HAD superfamily hydrolase